jgi:hypothetical protein
MESCNNIFKTAVILVRQRCNVSSVGHALDARFHDSTLWCSTPVSSTVLLQLFNRECSTLSDLDSLLKILIYIRPMSIWRFPTAVGVWLAPFPTVITQTLDQN